VTDGRWAASDGNVRPSSRGGLQVQRGIIIDTSQRRPDRQTDRRQVLSAAAAAAAAAADRTSSVREVT